MPDRERPFSSTEVRQYWEAIHRTHAIPPGDLTRSITSNLLRPVCHPDAPDFVNLFVHSLQREAMDWALKHIPPKALGGRVLDAGCGTGRWARLLVDRGASVVGVDLSPTAIATARALVPEAEFHCQDLLAVTFPPQHFDLIVSVTVLQHLPYQEQERVFLRFRQLLKPGGYVVMLENIRDRGRHVFARDLDGWMAVAEHCNLVTVAVRGYEFVPVLRALTRARRILARSAGRRNMTDGRRQRIDVGVRRYRQALLRVAVALSGPVEALSRRLLPAACATHGAFVFRAQS